MDQLKSVLNPQEVTEDDLDVFLLPIGARVALSSLSVSTACKHAWCARGMPMHRRGDAWLNRVMFHCMISSQAIKMRRCVVQAWEYIEIHFISRMHLCRGYVQRVREGVWQCDCDLSHTRLSPNLRAPHVPRGLAKLSPLVPHLSSTTLAMLTPVSPCPL